MRQSISVVVPAFNEEHNIYPLCAQITSMLRKISAKYELILVNDGSTDKTLVQMVAAKKRFGNIKIIDLRKNYGQSAALRAGFDSARFDLVAYVDADLQVDFSQFPKFLEKINAGADCVVGWRFERRDPFFKTLCSMLASRLRALFLGSNIHDYGCPFKVMRIECLKELNLYGEMHRYIPPILRWRGYRVEEVKITHRPRQHGKTKYSARRLYKGFLDMLVVWFWQKYAYRPMHIFGGVGLVAIVFGVVFGVWLVFLRLIGQISLVSSSFPLFDYIIFLTGVMLFCFGIISDVLVRTNLEGSMQKNYLIRKKI